MPKHHRDRLEADGITRMMVTVDLSRCLLIYPMPEWAEFEAQLMKAPNSDSRVRSMQRLYMGFASEVEFDSNGRILLPQPLREHARIKKKTVLIGQGNKCELWSEEEFDAAAEKWSEEIGDFDLTTAPDAIQQLKI